MLASVGPADRIALITLGLSLILAAFVSDLAIFASPVMQWSSAVVGAVLMITGMVRCRPLCTFFGLSTCKVHNQ